MEEDLRTNPRRSQSDGEEDPKNQLLSLRPQAGKTEIAIKEKIDRMRTKELQISRLCEKHQLVHSCNLLPE